MTTGRINQVCSGQVEVIVASHFREKTINYNYFPISFIRKCKLLFRRSRLLSSYPIFAPRDNFSYKYEYLLQLSQHCVLLSDCGQKPLATSSHNSVILIVSLETNRFSANFCSSTIHAWHADRSRNLLCQPGQGASPFPRKFGFKKSLLSIGLKQPF